MKEKMPPGKTVCISEKLHAVVRLRAAQLGMSVREVVEVAMLRGMPSANPKSNSKSKEK